MVERQDIDALLISALYGELTPSEETRLAAHLDSHPGDRTALADLTHARGLVRESRLFQVQLDPPPAISALLMKEATRCAPKPEVSEGWFARFVRSFAAHPAMAAAAMLVVVLGVATLVTRRSGDQFAESTAPASSSQPVIESERAALRDQMPGDSTARTGSSVASAGSAAVDNSVLEGGKQDSYRVALDEGLGQGKDNAADADGLADKLADKKVAKQKRDEVTVSKPMVDGSFNSKLAKEQQATSGKKTPPGIELRAPLAEPKDFDDDTRSKGRASESTKAESKNGLAFGNNDVSDNRARGQAPTSPATGAVAGGTASGSMPSGGESSGGAAPSNANSRRAPEPAPAAVQPAPQPTTTATATRPSAPRATTAPPPATPPAATKTAPRRDAPAKAVDRNATARAAAPAEDKPADPQLAWARDQHAMLIAQVRAGECKKAAGIATTISNRAPAYYQQNVETDRSVKACIAYINTERERDAEQRSERARANQKRSVNEPSPKAAPPAKATPTDAATSK